MDGLYEVRETISTSTKDLIVVMTAGIGLFLSTLDTGIINVALPTLSHVFHSTVSSIAWTVTLYTLALTGTIIMFGRIGDRYGRLQIYTWGLVVFAVSSVLCGLSQNTVEIVAFRTMQGIGAAMLQATAIAIITTTIPQERRGTALGTLGILMGLGPVIGPSAGGFIISFLDWRWIFWINIPIVLVGLIGCRRLSRTISEKHSIIPLDVKGNFLLSVSVLALLQGLSMWATTSLYSPQVLVSLGAFVSVFVLFVIHELYTKQPILDLRLFRKREFTAPVLATFVFGGASAIGFIVPPYFLEQVSHLATWQVGFVNLASPLGVVLWSRIAGRLLSRWGSIRLMVVGLITMLVSYLILGQIKATWSPWLLATLLFLYGSGGGLFIPSNISAIMRSVGRDMQGTIGAVQRMVLNLGIAIDTAVTATLISTTSHANTIHLMNGFRHSWNYAALTILFSLVVFLTAKMELRNRIKKRMF